MSDFNFKKKFGQNFLQDNSIIEKIVNSIDATENDLILEIGPGAGAITSKIKKYNCQIICYEIDTDTKAFLNNLENNKTRVIYEDILETDIKKEIKNINYQNLYIIGNLPYYITTPIIEKIIEENLVFKSFTLMVQKEVADRFLAHTKTRDYGYMTALLNYYYNIEKIVDAPNFCFKPAPKVDSSVLKFIPKTMPEVDTNKLKKLLKDSFQFKRKTIKNNLKQYDLEKIEKILKVHNFSLESRAEEIDIYTYIDLANNI